MLEVYQSHNGDDFLVVGLALILTRNKADLIMVIVAQATDVAHGHIVHWMKNPVLAKNETIWKLW